MKNLTPEEKKLCKALKDWGNNKQRKPPKPKK